MDSSVNCSMAVRSIRSVVLIYLFDYFMFSFVINKNIFYKIIRWFCIFSGPIDPILRMSTFLSSSLYTSWQWNLKYHPLKIWNHNKLYFKKHFYKTYKPYGKLSAIRYIIINLTQWRKLFRFSYETWWIYYIVFHCVLYSHNFLWNTSLENKLMINSIMYIE